MIIASEAISVPNGPTKQKYYSEGYRAAMADIAALVNDDGPEPWNTRIERLDAIREWIENNSSVRFF